MLSVGNLYNPDVRYSFNIPIEDKPQQFFWDAYGPWQECSRLCQGEWEAQGISKMRWWEWSVINGVVRLKMGWKWERRRGKHWARGPGERGLSGWTWQVHARRIGFEQVIKVRPRSILWQISLSGITPHMSDCLGRQRRIAGKLENLQCVMTLSLFWGVLYSLFDTALLEQPTVNIKQKPMSSQSRVNS